MKKSLLILIVVLISMGAFAQNCLQSNIDYGKTAYEAGDFDKAITCFSNAKKCSNFNGSTIPDEWLAKCNDRLEEIIIKKEAEQAAIKQCYTDNYNKAELYYNDFEIDSALDYFKKAIECGYKNGVAQEKIDECLKITPEYAYETGLTYIDQEDYEKAKKLFYFSANKGNSDSQNAIGEMYYSGIGYSVDYSEAMKWFLKAGGQGNSESQCRLGRMYRFGEIFGIPQDYKEAFKWYEKAAEQESVEAQNNLGLLYQYGNGVPQDNNLAFNWYRKAADQGFNVAQNNLGWMYQNGLGVAQDINETLLWYSKAAEQGNANAQNSLGLMYQNGKKLVQKSSRTRQSTSNN